ncbi:MAG: beta-ketoacyl synthase N-terminal-like domain-containing protein, partial [Verrucomicrobiota bacterium]
MKANIGHTTAAAGVLSLIKVLLSLKHRQLPPSIHFDQPNEQIDFADSPFVVNRSLTDWPQNAKGSRLAAVSSFGFSGTNAHLLVEEVAVPASAPATNQPAIIVLSAKNVNRLEAMARNLHAFLEREPSVNLTALAYTLQTGREALEERWATRVGSVDELLTQLNHFGDSGHGFRGRTDDDGHGLVAGEDMAEMAGLWIRRGEIMKLPEYWVKGAEIDWHLLYGETPPRRISLPTYPFERHSVVAKRVKEPEPVPTPPPVLPDPVAVDVPPPAPAAPTAKPTISLTPLAAAPVPRPVEMPMPVAAPAEPEPPPPSPPPVQTGDAAASLEDYLRETLADALFMDLNDIDVKKPFIDMGLDSIIGVEWMNAINKKFGLNVGATRVYDYPNISDMASFLVEEIEKAGGTPILAVAEEPKKKDPTPAPELSEEPSAPIEPWGEAEPSVADERIAIVGMSGRYPGAADLDAYWELLARGGNAVIEVPKTRWDVGSYYDPEPGKPGKVYCKWLGALDEIDCFDPLFFMISPVEAEGMDPQHRLFLEEAYHAFEHAGYGPAALNSRKCGVYLGISMNNEYANLLMRSAAEGSNTGNSCAIAAARISYYLNLKGPAIPIDTACSSSLVATHLACQALSRGEVDMALTGGVSLYLMPEGYIGMCEAGMLSPTGQCRAFDDAADGFVP